MGAQDRDWYRDWWRKRLGYTEKAAFRLGHGEVLRARRASAWRRNFIWCAVVLSVIAGLAFLR